MNIRNLFSAALALLLCATMLAGCAAPKDAVTSDPPADSAPAAPGSSGPSKPAEPEPTAPTEDKLSFPTQLQLIADNVKQWALAPDFADDRTGYASPIWTTTGGWNSSPPIRAARDIIPTPLSTR